MRGGGLVDWCLLAPGTVYIRSMVPPCAIALLKLPSSINLTYRLTVINIRSIDTNRRVPIVHSINGCLLSIAPLLTQGPIASRLHLTNTVPVPYPYPYPMYELCRPTFQCCLSRICGRTLDTAAAKAFSQDRPTHARRSHSVTSRGSTIHSTNAKALCTCWRKKMGGKNGKRGKYLKLT